MSEHFDSKPGQIRWTDDEILGALEEMNKRLPSGAHSAIAVMRMMRDSYEITRQSANRHIASQEARIAELEAAIRLANKALDAMGERDEPLPAIPPDVRETLRDVLREARVVGVSHMNLHEADNYRERIDAALTWLDAA